MPLAIAYEKSVRAQSCAIDGTSNALAIERLYSGITHNNRLPGLVPNRFACERASFIEQADGDSDSIAALSEFDGYSFHRIEDTGSRVQYPISTLG